MNSLPFCRLSCTSMCKYILRNINLNSYHLRNMRLDNLMQVKRCKHLCRLVKSNSVTVELAKNSDLKYKFNPRGWNTCSSSTLRSCQPIAVDGSVRMFFTSTCYLSDNKNDDILKDDPFLKDLLKEIRKDFSSDSKKTPPVSDTDECKEGEKEEILKENNDKKMVENKVGANETSGSISDIDTSSSSDSSDEDGSSSSDEDGSSSSDEDEDSTSVRDDSRKLSHEQQSSPSDPDIDIGGFISLDPVDSFEEVEEFPDTFEPEEVPRWESPIGLKITGVYDIEELVVLLKAENAKDVCVIRMPDHLNLGDYIVITTAWSYRHMKAITKNIVSLYKLKKNPSDNFPLVSGVDEGEWVAFDLGNIILHIFKEDVREKYDLETLWAVGPKFDDKSEQVVSPYILEDSDMEWLKEFYKEKAEN